MSNTRYFLIVLGAMLMLDAHAFEPFVIKDIQVEGAQRTEPGTVFSYLPVKPGDTMTDEKATQSIRALYETGFFKDVKLEVRGSTLVITVDERPSIAQISFGDIKEFNKDELIKAMKQVGIAEGRILDRALLDKAEQELKRQYISRGKYSTTVKTTVTPLENNRVSVSFDIVEGDVAKIRQIKIIGNKIFSEKELLDEFTLRTPGWITWYTKEDQYSKQKLGADLEKLRSYYLDRGYLEFNVESTQVSITPDKKDVYITVAVTEGAQYKVSDIRLGGELLIPEAEARKLIKIETGDVFSRAKLTESTKLITDRLGNDGYAFANVNAVPELDREKHEAAFTFFVDPGRRVYVRRINVTGNTRTRDEVIRREVRQIEGGWYSADKIDQSKKRIDRLGYFEEVNVETPAVAGTTDQIDVNLSVKEKPTGTIMLGAGYGTTDGVILSGSVSQQNIFGSGNHVAVQVNTSRSNTVYSLSFTNPYWTPDGISRSYDIYKRVTDPTALYLGTYRTSTVGGNIRFGVPISEIDAIQFGLGAEANSITVYADSPVQVINYVNTFGSDTTTLLATLGWARDSRDSALWTTTGTVQRATSEIGLPGGSLQYFKAQYQYQRYFALNKTFTLLAGGDIGYGVGIGGDPLPFFKNYYAGGVSTVRGFQSSTIGPKDAAGQPTGGSRRLVLNSELLFPIPGLPIKDKSVRGSVFIDAGLVGEDYAVDDMRASTGVAVLWTSPFGPIKVSVAAPFRSVTGDKTQVFQFTFGQQF